MNKEEYLKNIIVNNKLDISYRSILNAVKYIDDYKNIIYTNNFIKIDNFYFIGLIHLIDGYISKKYTKMFYYCEDCGKFLKSGKGKQRNPDSGKYICQPCSCKYTNNQLQKRIKNSKTIKERYNNGELDHLRKLYRENRIKFNKTIQAENIKNFSKEKKERIKNKKRNTFYKKTKEERDLITYKRTKAFRKYNFDSHSRKLKYLKSLTKEEAMISREYQYDFNNDWKIITEDIRNKSNNKCSCCLKEHKTNVSIHHTIPFSLRPKNIELIPLCKSCHIKIENRFREKYEETNNIYISQEYSLKILKDNIIYYGHN